jgi:mannose-6-phosphate isomerase-like protein (cupin superfamily)
MIEKIEVDNKLVALIIRSNYFNDGIEFFTPNSFSQQVGYMNRPSGYIIDPHVHKHIERKVVFTQEVLFIKSGMLRVDLYDANQRFLESKILKSGDIILLASGGHGFEMIKDTEIIEIKQGPYCGDEDKVRFKPIKKNDI